LSILPIDIPVLKIEHGTPLFFKPPCSHATSINVNVHLGLAELAYPPVRRFWLFCHFSLRWSIGDIVVCERIVATRAPRSRTTRTTHGRCALCPDKSRRVASIREDFTPSPHPTHTSAISSHASRDVQASTAPHRDVRQQPPILIAHEQANPRAARGARIKGAFIQQASSE
jgi:hypothetical protein